MTLEVGMRSLLPVYVLVVLASVSLFSCDESDPSQDSVDAWSDTNPGGKADSPAQAMALNAAAGGLVLYEVQARTANACDPQLGADWQRTACLQKVAPKVKYQAETGSCSTIADLERIRLGTLDDLLEDTADYREGITVRYIDEKVGANALWLMPIFPNNATWELPSACDNLGSPYAVRDYMHARGSLGRACSLAERDESSAEPCWADDSLGAVIAEAASRHMTVLLDVAFNHFGHNYLYYDTKGAVPVHERLAAGASYEKFWDFEATYDDALLYPDVLDASAELDQLVAASSAEAKRFKEFEARCPNLSGQHLVRAFSMWRVTTDAERKDFSCNAETLEQGVPGFFLGANRWDPARSASDTYSNEWRDVKFLYHQQTNAAYSETFLRNREYLFRVLNTWVSRGVGGFRLDHSAEYTNGLAAMEWYYILSKVNYYAMRRGQPQPVYLAEEFWDQKEISKVVDIMTEGYVHDMAGRNVTNKDAAHVEDVLRTMDRFGGETYVMTALETHDERRLLDGAGFDAETGAGFWGIGAATWSTPMLLMGQEFGEAWQLSFRRSDVLRSRFEGTDQFRADGPAITELYRSLIEARLAPENRALIASDRAFLRTADGNIDSRILAMVKWSQDGNVVFALHNLWRQQVAQRYQLPDGLGDALLIDRSARYQLVDVFGGEPVAACLSGQELRDGLYVEMAAEERVQWLRLELCP